MKWPCLAGLLWYTGDNLGSGEPGRLVRLDCSPDCPHVQTCAASQFRKPAPAAVASGVQLTSWRHGYRTGLSQAAELLRRRQDAAGLDADTVGDAIRTLQGWIADLS